MGKSSIKKVKYDVNHIIAEYNLSLTHQSQYLDELTAAPINSYNFDMNDAWLERHRRRLERKGAFFNEEELKMRFIAFLFEFADIEVDGKIELFFERTISADLNAVFQSVKCDCLLASPYGIYEPKAPYFFLQGFKKQKQQEDAEGQMLVAMLVAQAINKNNKPVYGCWLQGRYWVFATLYEHDYCISRTYEVTRKDDLYQIIHILQNLKTILLASL